MTGYRRLTGFAAFSLLGLAAAPGLAQAPAARAAPPAATAAAAASGPAPAASSPARPETPPSVHVRVIEDDNVRIEESRVRGQTRRITVQNKNGGPGGYEILVTPGGKDTTQDRGPSGQRAWSLFAF